MHMYAKCDQNISCGSRFMNIFKIANGRTCVTQGSCNIKYFSFRQYLLSPLKYHHECYIKCMSFCQNSNAYLLKEKNSPNLMS